MFGCEVNPIERVIKVVTGSHITVHTKKNDLVKNLARAVGESHLNSRMEWVVTVPKWFEVLWENSK